MVKDDCVFCGLWPKIVSGEIKTFLWGPNVNAFTPLNEATPGHLLVVPTRHIETFLDLDPEEAAGLFATVQEVALRRFESLDPKPDGMNLIVSAGEAATQTICHLHWHVVPRYYGDRLGDIWFGGRADDAEREDAKRRLRGEKVDTSRTSL